ncbi:ZIP family metal transporter [Halapricum hydrolyticum]|uniref:ZIP family metal transporter n=1 Tax=Halapricum hydrolyticum TaxID=2979991 RepID=A0AAE3LG92_9EURY|nr:ZIP family metal transporter [Halapricum hydrolyticum]MCU4719265.1 ZIP family metal transporter [Halapricum hydrolyticum]MCU4728550.1 ZIP family metal transporter [Halapricum hydrolyticum]
MVGSVATEFTDLFGSNPVVHGLVGGLFIATMNLIGASLVLVWRDPSERTLDGALGFAAGVMMAAAFTSLILPGIDATEVVVPGVAADGLVQPLPVLFGVLLGALALDRSDVIVPHAHYLLTGRKRRDAAGPGETVPSVDDPRVASVVLFILAITLHNMPEGLAVGVGFGSGNVADALPLMLAIGIQNVPEGLAVSVAAINAGLNRRAYAIFAGIRAGVVEVPLAVAGAAAVVVFEPLLPYAMGFAAGAMLFVISDEIVPETHTRGNERIATLGLMVGVVLMLYLDVALG